MITTVPRNHTRRIAELREQLTRCRVHTLAGGFACESVDPAEAWRALDRYSGRLTDNGDGSYTIRLHSNAWYSLRAGKTAAEVAGQLASFNQYPPEENARDGQCLLCSFPVRALQGLIALGHDMSGTFAAHLHRGCAAEVSAAQQLAERTAR